MQRGSANINKPPHTNKAGANENERATGIETIFRISQISAIWRKLAVISMLTALAENRHLARFAQNYAVPVFDFVRKDFSRVSGDGK
jgi:hypothetical protein